MKKHGLRALKIMVLIGFGGCVYEPTNGQIVTSSPSTTTLTFSGYHPTPNVPITIQVPAKPDTQVSGDYYADSNNWVVVGNATSGTTPGYWNDPSRPFYTWTTTAKPAQADAARWPAGGIMRFRAVDSGGMVLTGFDHDNGYLSPCWLNNAGLSWLGVGNTCKTLATYSALVNPTPTPADNTIKPNYLSYLQGTNGKGSDAETTAYYNSFKTTAWPIPTTLAAFKQAYGFNVAGSDQVTATYFNAGDLGTGRQMTCKSFIASPAPSPAPAASCPTNFDPATCGRVCYVSNYADANGVNFGGNPASAVDRAIVDAKAGNSDNAFATVVMAYHPPSGSINSVRFAVYGALDAATNTQPLITHAKLDSLGAEQGIPHNCIVCHGAAKYDSGKHQIPAETQYIHGARFLPFDLNAFSYSTNANNTAYTRAAQEDKFRQLNRHVKLAETSATVRQLIDGFYTDSSGVNHLNDAVPSSITANTDYVLPGYNQDAASQRLYREVYAPYCRTCHGGQTRVSFGDAASFKGAQFGIAFLVCNNPTSPGDAASYHVMPNSEVTMKRMWQSPARAYLAGMVGVPGSCAPK